MFVAKINALKRITHISGLILLPVFLAGCAKLGSPYGGPKDETPPKVIKASPPEESTNFIPQKKIVITFDEYILIKNIFQEMILSPPIDGNMQALVKGKSLVIEFPKDVVLDTVTYTLSFGNSIEDNNEGNVLKNYEYVFSLKGYLDSMNVKGKILNAFNHKPDKDRMYVMLYRNLADSAPLLEKPSYICRTDEQGNFSLRNIETGKYRIFGLKDANYNLLFDLPNEQIAFSDSLIELTPGRFKEEKAVYDSMLFKQNVKSDTIETDSAMIADTAAATDSVRKSEFEYTFHTELLFFTQEVKNQYLSNNMRPTRNQLVFTFNQELSDSVNIFPLDYIPQTKNWFMLDENKQKDTLIYWLTDTNMINLDSLKIELCFPAYDSSEHVYFIRDTLLMMAQVEKPVSTRGRKERNRSEESAEERPKKTILMLKNNIKNAGAFDLDKKIVISSPTPCFNAISDRIKLFRMRDTVEVPVRFEMYHDSSSFYKYIIDYEPEETTSYRLLIPDSTFFDIYGSTQDTVNVHFKTQSEDFYGVLTLHMKNVKCPIILQLMDEKENVLKERYFISDEDLRFGYLYPKKYLLKVIYDINGNQKWDTGDYLRHIQPERVIYYSQTAEVRSNWEMDFIWELPE